MDTPPHPWPPPPAADLLFFGGCLVYRLATNTALKNARRTGFGTSGQVVMWWLKPKGGGMACWLVQQEQEHG